MYITYFIICIIVCSFSDVHGEMSAIDKTLRKQYMKRRTRAGDGFSFKNAKRVASWKPEDGTNPWELSGLIEGDIMPTTDDALWRDGYINDKYKWKNGIVPYLIAKDEFNIGDVQKIMEAINEYHTKTCIKFRPYKSDDQDYLILRSVLPGCWSSVGRQSGAQLISLQRPGCNRRGVVIHELLHALGFFHQHSASGRDKYIEIKWENVREGMEANFRTYDSNPGNQYNENYDYKSIMHYSSKAFSKNEKDTIKPLTDDVKIGQKDHLSFKDVKKLNNMYKTECENRDNKHKNNR